MVQPSETFICSAVSNFLLATRPPEFSRHRVHDHPRERGPNARDRITSWSWGLNQHQNPNRGALNGYSLGYGGRVPKNQPPRVRKGERQRMCEPVCNDKKIWVGNYSLIFSNSFSWSRSRTYFKKAWKEYAQDGIVQYCQHNCSTKKKE